MIRESRAYKYALKCVNDSSFKETLNKDKLKFDYTIKKECTSEEANSWWNNYNGSKPPYKPNTKVYEVKLKRDTSFVRVYNGNESQMKGGWVMDKKALKD